jgi:prepilin-type N-terminal cleavage/methylation domain-containing protein
MNYKNAHKGNSLTYSDGFSLIELLIVLVMISILSGTAFYYLNASRELYKADEQALKITDILQEARQRALTQRENMRVEIDLTDNIIRLIDENQPDTVDDDNEIRNIPILSSTELRLDQRPAQITYNPPEDFPVPSARFKQSVYTPSLLHNVSTLRFLSNGTVVDQGNNTLGDGAVPTGVTLHVWSPDKDNINNSKIARSITIIGSSGSVRLWEYDKNLETANKWKDTRRISVFGGQTGN